MVNIFSAAGCDVLVMYCTLAGVLQKLRCPFVVLSQILGPEMVTCILLTTSRAANALGAVIQPLTAETNVLPRSSSVQRARTRVETRHGGRVMNVQNSAWRSRHSSPRCPLRAR